MDKYLRCPVAFYYENILRVPSARTSPFGFGRAIHESLHQFIQKHRTDAKADVERYKEYYIDSMKNINLTLPQQNTRDIIIKD